MPDIHFIRSNNIVIQEGFTMSVTLQTAGSAKCETVKFLKITHDSIVCRTADGSLLEITSHADNAIRIRRTPNQKFSSIADPVFPSLTRCNGEFEENRDGCILRLKRICASVSGKNGLVTLTDPATGKIVFQEKQYSFTPSPSIDAEPDSCRAELQFNDKGQIFGLGEFQDGYLEISRLPRDLIQVNTQASVPMLYSSTGYGLYWHNFSRTNFNLPVTPIHLRREGEGKATIVNISTGSGGAEEIRKENSWTGNFTLTGKMKTRCAFELDCGQVMAGKLILYIDGKCVVNCNNLWLPPRIGVRDILLAPGKHSVRVIVNDGDIPALTMRTGRNLPQTLSAEDVKEMDYFIFTGSADEVINSFRRFSGRVPMLPRYAFGYWHCRERFHNQEELLDNLREFRRRKIPLDVIVQDWQWWEQGKWNSMSFDPQLYPDPEEMNRQIHALNAHSMLSVWSKVDRNCDFGKVLEKNNAYIKDTIWIDFTNPDAGEVYWQQMKKNIVSTGIDSWWFDATEPENDDLKDRSVSIGRGNAFRNIYPLYVNRFIAAKLRGEQPDKRTLILTRCAFAGQQSCPSVVWSGDIGSDWKTLKKQIACGLGMSISGIPYWTTDTGGFFRPGDQYGNRRYHERFIRWFQFSVFCPILRVHGFVSNTELWRYGEKVERLVRSYLDLRYQLLPYIYSMAGNVSLNAGTMMRPLVMDFPHDRKAGAETAEYMFGSAFLVAPVTSHAVSRRVYLPSGASWINFWNGEKFSGGQTVKTAAPLEQIPLFVRCGSIVPWGKAIQHTGEYDPSELEIRIYPGSDGEYVLYEDNGIDYEYENGGYSLIRFRWNDAENTLTIADREGDFRNMPEKRLFRITLVTPGGQPDPVAVSYCGKGVSLSLKPTPVLTIFKMA